MSEYSFTFLVKKDQETDVTSPSKKQVKKQEIQTLTSKTSNIQQRIQTIHRPRTPN